MQIPLDILNAAYGGCRMQWSDFAPLPTPIAFAAAGSIYGHVLLMGGCDSGNKWLSSVLRCVPQML